MTELHGVNRTPLWKVIKGNGFDSRQIGSVQKPKAADAEAAEIQSLLKEEISVKHEQELEGVQWPQVAEFRKKSRFEKRLIKI